MAHNKTTPDNQLVLSPELLLLFEWLFEHEQEGLKKLIHQAYRNGLEKKLSQKLTSQSVTGAQQTVFDFFALVEALSHEVCIEREEQSLMQQVLIPAIHQMDVPHQDSHALAASIDKATSSLYDDTSSTRAKEVLCKEFIKRWKPLINKKSSN